MRNKHLIGHFGVDSGQVMIVDPCYLDKWEDTGPGELEFTPGKNLDFSYNGACNASLSDKGFGELHHGAISQYAVVSTTGIGDGVYPVYAEVENIGGWGERVVRLVIDFSDHPMLAVDEDDKHEGENTTEDDD
jgi:hypothetical protein